MKFAQRFSIRKTLKTQDFGRGIWNPTTRAWRDVIEDYLWVSRKRVTNKLSMFKLQLHLASDIVTNYEHIYKYKEKLKELSEEEPGPDAITEQKSADISYIKSEIIGLEIIVKALREIADGLVWRFFEYNRAILYMLADKQPIEPVKMDQGLIRSLYELGEVFLDPSTMAILNDMTNFLRVGDVTKINEDGTIELIEVKSGKTRNRRITRQRQKMTELVEFFNTGYGEYDGVKLSIRNSYVRQKNYLSSLLESIKRAKYRGCDSILIGDYLILETVYAEKCHDVDTIISFCESKHSSVKDSWESKKDIVVSDFLIRKLEYSRNYAPFSIFPFDVDICTDIMMGRVWIRGLLNVSKILTRIEKGGWTIVDSLFLRDDEQLRNLAEDQMPDIPWLLIRKGPLTLDIPITFLGRVLFEVLSPDVLLAEAEELLNSSTPLEAYDAFLTNYVNERSMWR